VGLSLGLCLVALATALPLRHLPIDDKYIVAVYARNLAEHGAWAFNLGEPLNASTSTLNPLLGAAAGLLGLPIPAALWWVSLAATAIAICLLIGLTLPGSSGTLWIRCLWVAALTAASPFLAGTYGLESSLFLLAMVIIGLAVDRGQWSLAFIAAGLICLVRGEGVLIATLLFPVAWVARRRVPLPVALWTLVPTVPWALFSWWQFGTPLPSTLAAKQLQGSSGIFPGDITKLMTHLLTGISPALGVTLAVLATASLLRVHRWKPSVYLFALFALIAGALLWHWQIPATSYFWYGVPFLVVAVWISGEGVAALHTLLGPRSGMVIALALIAIVPWLASNQATWLQSTYEPKLTETTLYREAGRWIDAHAEPGASVAVTEIGQNGWHMRRRLVDLAGLISPEIGEAAHRDFNLTRWIWEEEPDFVLLRVPNDRIVQNALLGLPGFALAYETIETFGEPGGVRMVLRSRTRPLAEAAADFERERQARIAATGGSVSDEIAEANARMNWTAGGVWSQLAPSSDLTVTLEEGEGLILEPRGEDPHLWLPWINVPACAVSAIRLTLDVEAPTRQRGMVLQIQWRGKDAEGIVLPYGMIESLVPINAGPVEVVFTVAGHPRLSALERLQRLRITLRNRDAHVRLVRVELIP
jgi:arabinofuranosyltransferase